MRKIGRPLVTGGVPVLLAFAGFLIMGEPRTAAQEAPPSSQEPGATFRVAVDLVTTDVIVRDSDTDAFIADLVADDFEVYEDGIRQEVVSLVLTHGGRVFNVRAPAAAPVAEGIILPTVRPTSGAAGRVFLIFIDDLHLEFKQTLRTRDLLRRVLRTLVHDGDMFGIVSTGGSSIAEDLTYDRQVLESAIERVAGSGLSPADIIQGQQGRQGNPELRYRARVAFRTAYDLVNNLAKLRNRRKAVIYISSGYDFDPYAESRVEYQQGLRNFGGDDSVGLDTLAYRDQVNNSMVFAESELIQELAELTNAANRANATFYTIDPRGLVAGPDIGDSSINIGSMDWQDHLTKTQNSLRVLAEETGGMAIINRNNFDDALTRIDAETSDYYVLGYYSNNPDPLKRTRELDVRVMRDGVDVNSRTSYSLQSAASIQ